MTLSRMSWAVDVFDSDAGVRTVARGAVPSSMRRFCESIDKKAMSVPVAYAMVKNYAKQRNI